MKKTGLQTKKHLAHHVLPGDGVAKDKAEDKKWKEKAGAQGHIITFSRLYFWQALGLLGFHSTPMHARYLAEPHATTRNRKSVQTFKALCQTKNQ
jgi:hypothetical protein